MGLLSLAIWTPIFFGVVLLALGRDEQARAVRWLALIGAVVSFLVTLPLYSRFEIGSSAMQFVENLPWIARFNVNYHLGLDGISLWFVLLTAFINIIVVIASWESITRRVNQYMGAFMILSGLMIGVFAALDGLLFFVFFEATKFMLTASSMSSMAISSTIRFLRLRKMPITDIANSMAPSARKCPRVIMLFSPQQGLLAAAARPSSDSFSRGAHGLRV